MAPPVVADGWASLTKAGNDKFEIHEGLMTTVGLLETSSKS